mmetsp:Transcript_5839/g.12761  ORF Transcript_5839/g.12761 Transcript_5839/m.12761 type:complete len:245 (+) Transcript_5839:225-959(+)
MQSEQCDRRGRSLRSSPPVPQQPTCLSQPLASQCVRMRMQRHGAHVSPLPPPSPTQRDPTFAASQTCPCRQTSPPHIQTVCLPTAPVGRGSSPWRLDGGEGGREGGPPMVEGVAPTSKSAETAFISTPRDAISTLGGCPFATGFAVATVEWLAACPVSISPGPTRERRTGRKMRPCAAPKTQMPKNCLKKARKIYDCEEERTSTAAKVEAAPCTTAVPISPSALSALSCFVPFATTKACAMWEE